MKINSWFDAVHQCQHQGLSYVLITVISAAGSTPRENGCKMVVSIDSQFDTIGGGHLEHMATQKARALLYQGKDQQLIESYPLASKLGQCCGGAVKILFEAHCQHTQHVAVFGMGHVAQALIPILSQLPLQISWIDQRENLVDTKQVANNVKCIVDEDCIANMAELPDASWAIILTHNHQLDYELVEQGLKQGRLGYLGMIGSQTKANRFRLRLANRGFSQEQIASLVSPIGKLDIAGKRPIEVAVSIAAQLIEHLNEEPANEPTNMGTTNKKTVVEKHKT